MIMLGVNLAYMENCLALGAEPGSVGYFDKANDSEQLQLISMIFGRLDLKSSGIH